MAAAVEHLLTNHTHRKIVCPHPGGPDLLQYVEPAETLIPECKSAADVVIKVLTTTATYTDILVLAGTYRDLNNKTFPFPVTPGYDVIGVVTVVGKTAQKYFSVGDMVACLCQYDGCQEYLVTGHQNVNKIDIPSVDAVKIVTLVLTGITAFQMLHRAGFSDVSVGSGGNLIGQKILIHSCTGGTGSMAVRLARLAGILPEHIYGTCSARNFDFARSLGCGNPIDYSGETAWASHMPPGGVDIVLDAIGGDYYGHSINALRPGGRYVAYGFTNTSSPGNISIPSVLWQFFKMFCRSSCFSCFDGKRAAFYNIAELKAQKPDLYHKDLHKLISFVSDGLLDVPIEKVVNLEGAIGALQSIAKMQNRGKIVVVVDRELEKIERVKGRLA